MKRLALYSINRKDEIKESHITIQKVIHIFLFLAQPKPKFSENNKITKVKT